MASSSRSLKIAAALRKTSLLYAGFVLLHDFRAFCAASTAFSASETDAAEHFQHVLLSRGEVTSNVLDVMICSPLNQRGTVDELSNAAWALPFVPFVPLMGIVEMVKLNS